MDALDNENKIYSYLKDKNMYTTITHIINNTWKHVFQKAPGRNIERKFELHGRGKDWNFK